MICSIEYTQEIEVAEAGLSQGTTGETTPKRAIIGSLYEQYYERIVRYIFVRIHDRSEAENLGGDVFVRALQSMDSYRGHTEQMRGWLFKIAHNLVVDYLRRIGKPSDISIDEIEIPDGQNLEQAVEGKLEVERLSRALKQLTPAQREVIGLRFFAGLSSAEAGRVLGKRSGAVRQMQYEAIEVLRKEMYVEPK
jgi:RNA polymerase sigma-70 factor (ECF subfamily)